MLYDPKIFDAAEHMLDGEPDVTDADIAELASDLQGMAEDFIFMRNSRREASAGQSSLVLPAAGAAA